MRTARGRGLLRALAASFGVAALSIGAWAGTAAAPSASSATSPAGSAVAVDDDPQRFVADANDPRTPAWLRAEGARARATLDAIPGRTALLSRLRTIDEATPAAVGAPQWRPGELLFYIRRDLGGAARTLYVRHGFEGPERILFDPESAAGGGAPGAGVKSASGRAIRSFEASPGGRFVACSVAAPAAARPAAAASLIVVETRTGRVVAGPIENVAATKVGWLPDESGIFFTRAAPPASASSATSATSGARSYLFRLGGDPQRAQPVLGPGFPGTSIDGARDLPSVQVLPGTNLAAGIVVDGSVHGRRPLDIYVAPLASLAAGRVSWQRIVDRQERVTAFASVRDRLFLLAGDDGGGSRVLETTIGRGRIESARIVAQDAAGGIRTLSRALDGVYFTRRAGAVAGLWRIGLEPNATAAEVPLPGAGSARIAAADPRVPGILVEQQSWMQARRYVIFDGRRVAATTLQATGPYDAPTDYSATEVMLGDVGGTDVAPRTVLTIVQRRDLVRDGTNPTRLRLRVGDDDAADPDFDARELAWLERGGVIAFAALRRGDAEAWKEAVACAAYLVEQRIASPSTLAVEGRDRAAALAVRTAIERPDLFAAVAAIGAAADSTLEARITTGVRYPAALLIGDATAVLAARLQQANPGGKPTLLLGASNLVGGNAADLRLSMRADAMSFMLWQFGVPGFQLEAR